MNTNFKVIALIRLGIKPESTAPEANALSLLPLGRACYGMEWKIVWNGILVWNTEDAQKGMERKI